MIDLAMRHIFCRPLRLHDEADKAAFIVAADKSGKEFPKDVFTLPSTRIMVAERGGEIVLYQPQFVSLTLGSLIPVIDDPILMAAGQHQLFGAAYTRAHAEGLADIHCYSNNELTRGFALRHGFQEIPDCLRMGVR